MNTAIRVVRVKIIRMMVVGTNPGTTLKDCVLSEAILRVVLYTSIAPLFVLMIHV